MSEPTPDSSNRGLVARLFIAYVASAILIFAAERIGTYRLFGFFDNLDAGAHRALAALSFSLVGLWSLAALLAFVLAPFVARRVGLQRVADHLPVIISGIVFATIGGMSGDILSRGAWISAQAWSAALPIAGGISGGIGGISAVYLARFLATTRRRAIASAVIVALAVAVSIAAQIGSMQGTYAEAYFTVFALCCAVMLAACYLGFAVRPFGSLRVDLLAALALVAVTLFSVSSAQSIDERSRSVLVLRSPIAANIMGLFYPEVETTFLSESLAVLDPNANPLNRDEQFGTELEDRGWNVLFIVVDTLRADVLPPARKTDDTIKAGDTPFMDAWLGDAVTFEHGYAQAAATHRSMPAMFQSLHVGEKAAQIGVPLAAQMSSTGRSTFAVVNNFFFEPRFKITKRLLAEFDRVSVYEKQEQENLVPSLIEQLRAHADRPFFGWVHFYNMHEPGFDGARQDPKIPLKTRYRNSLRWLDGEMKKIDAALRAEGLADRTIVVFTADHGEGLGDNHIRNHTTVYEEEIRVPIAIKVPGLEGRVIDQTVGNIDLLPTLLDLLGEQRNPLHRGRSLVPLLAGGEIEDRAYYMQDYKGKTHAIVIDRDKLFYREKSNVFHRFNLRDDPTEDKNLYGTGDVDERLRRELIEVNPKLVEAELKDETTLSLLHQRLDGIDPKNPGEAIRFLLRLAATSKLPQYDPTYVRLFQEATRDDVRALVYAETCRTSKPLQKAFEKHLRSVSDADRDALVARIAGLPCPKMNQKTVAGWMKKAPPAALEDYLLWTSTWKKNGSSFLPVWTDWLTDETIRDDPRLLRSLLLGVASTDWKDVDTSDLREKVRSFVVDPNPAICVAAIRASAKLGDQMTIDTLRKNLESPEVDLQVRQASIHAISKLKPGDAVALIAGAGADQVLVLDAIKALRALGDPAGLEFLDQTAADHYNRIIRNIAKSAAKSVRKRNAK